MINVKVWESFNGTRTPIAEMDTRHIINAIQVIERNDPRYGVKHGAALPALLAEVTGRATRDDVWRKDEEAQRFIASRNPPRYVGFDPAGASGYAGVTMFEAGTLVAARITSPKMVEGVCIGKTLDGTPVHAPAGTPTIASIDDRAARAHRRLDRVDEAFRGLRADPQRLDAMSKELFDAVERIADLEARITAIETPPKRKPARKVRK
jgi:hypothetical protein